MGSDKYPTENDFSAYLKAHGGDSNAATGYEKVYYCLYWYKVKAIKKKKPKNTTCSPCSIPT